MDCEYSFQEHEVTHMEEQYISHGIKLRENNFDPVGNNDTEETVFFPSETITPASTKIKLLPNIRTRRQSFSEDTHFLKVPSGDHHEDGVVTPYQFDRHAPERISTSPTLRRLRKSTSSSPQALQNGSENARAGKQVPQGNSSVSVCQISSSSLPHHSSSESTRLRTDSLLLREEATSAEPRSVQPSCQDNFNNDQSPKNSKGSNPSLMPESEQDSQGHVEESHLRKPTGQYRSTERRHSSVVVSLPGFEMFPGDLLIPDHAAKLLYHSASLQSSESKKPWWPFAKKGLGKDKQKLISDLENYLSTVTVKMSEYSSYEFHNVKDKTWHEIMKKYQLEPEDSGALSDTKKKEAVWELFTTECTYFLDHLLVLKMIFMDTLENLQSNAFLHDVDSGLLFANLDELNQISLDFVTHFFAAIKNHLERTTPSIDLIPVLAKYFEGNMSQSHQIYCLNYTSAVFYLEKLKKREDFGTYLKWCEQKEQCKRLHLSELLVAPLHKLTRYPLLLKNIWKHTEGAEKAVIGSLREKVNKSIRNLEGKVKWLDNFQKLKQLQEIIIWPSLLDQDKRFFLPEGLKNTLKDNPSENILSPTKRSLVHEGRLTLAEHMRVVDVYLFLFDDLLLITKPNRLKKKSGGSDLSITSACPFFSTDLQSLLEDGSYCTVLDQPIPLDRLTMKNVDSFHVTVLGLRNAFLIQHENRYQQCIAAFLLQAQTEAIKNTWVSQMETAILNYTKRLNHPQPTFSILAAESSEI